MNAPMPLTWIAFAGKRRLAFGSPLDVAPVVKAFADAQPETPVLILDARTSQVVEPDLRGDLAAVLSRLPSQAPTELESASEPEGKLARRPGRPRLGVVAREVTLLPRHWDWLAAQPGGASVALRKLVEQALRTNRDIDQARAARDAAYRFMHVMGGNEPGFEEASRALFANDMAALRACLAPWPRDVQDQVLALAALVSPG